MTGTILALAFFIVSIVLAVINNEYRAGSIWALWAIFLTLFLQGHYQLP